MIIRGIENFPDNTIRIYNRWGILVFSTSTYNTKGNVFDGNSKARVTVDQSKKLPAGTYFYVLDYKNEEDNSKSLTGYLYINL